MKRRHFVSSTDHVRHLASMGHSYKHAYAEGHSEFPIQNDASTSMQAASYLESTNQAGNQGIYQGNFNQGYDNKHVEMGVKSAGGKIDTSLNGGNCADVGAIGLHRSDGADNSAFVMHGRQLPLTDQVR